MITVATMNTNNPALILAAMAWNALYTLVAMAWNALQLLTIALLTVTATAQRAVVAAFRFALAHRRVALAFAGLVATVVVVALFWQAIVVTAGVFGAMYIGLKLVMRHR